MIENLVRADFLNYATASAIIYFLTSKRHLIL